VPSAPELKKAGGAADGRQSAIGMEGETGMPFYEHVFLARQDLATAQVDALSAALTEVIEGQGGKVVKTEYWGLRTITYRIKKNRKAHYVLLNVEAPATAVAELERNVALNEDIIRSMTIRVETLESGPSAMMRKVERSERGERSDRGERGDGEEGGRPPRRPRPDAAPAPAVAV
jgi:small subunit ribosomal protein S6